MFVQYTAPPLTMISVSSLFFVLNRHVFARQQCARFGSWCLVPLNHNHLKFFWGYGEMILLLDIWASSFILLMFFEYLNACPSYCKRWAVLPWSHGRWQGWISPNKQHTMVYEYNTPEYKYYSYLVISEQSSTRLLDCHFVMNELFVWAFSFSQELDPTMTEFHVSPVISTSMIKLSSCLLLWIWKTWALASLND